MKLFSPQQMPNKHEWTSIGDLLLDLPHDFWIFRHFHCFRMVRDRRTWLRLSDIVKAVVTMEPWRHWRAENMDSSAGSFIAVICWNKTFSQMSGLYMFISGFLGCFFNGIKTRSTSSKILPLAQHSCYVSTRFSQFPAESTHPSLVFRCPGAPTGHPPGTHAILPWPPPWPAALRRRCCGWGPGAGSWRCWSWRNWRKAMGTLGINH